jgi:hypothetical protein
MSDWSMVMNLGWKRAIPGAMRLAVVCLLGVAGANGQTETAPKPQMAEDVFKNVQVLRGISVDEFMDTMGFFAASLGMNCVDCHTSESVGNWAKFADDTPYKQMARKMVLMVRTINQANFGGKRMLTCYSCHRGSDRPKLVPSLTEQYATPPPDDPNEIERISDEPDPAALTAEQILDKYIQAVGGAQRAANLTSFMGKGTYSGYDSDFEKVPVDVFAKAPGMRATVIHGQLGVSVSTFDGHAAWVAAIDKPLPLMPLTGGDLDGAKADADLAFPAGIKQAFTNWRAGFPDAAIDSHKMSIVQGTSPGGSRVKLYFDKESGLLVRQLRFSDSAVGLNPTQVDYSDYRDVAGVKLPFHWIATWTDGQSTTELSEVQPNVAIDSAKFAKPAPALPPKIPAQK